MYLSRRRVLGTGVALMAACAAMPVLASNVPNPFVIYIDGLKNDWVSWSWAKVTLGVSIGDVQPIMVEVCTYAAS